MVIAPWLGATLTFACVVILYFGTFSSMAATWWTSDTFAHGMLVFPISLWLAWTVRHRLQGLKTSASGLGFVVLAVLGLCWLLAHIADVQVVQQGALVLMIPALVLAIFGADVARVMMFPLFFLLFAVPFGEGLIPYLMEFTASFTVNALQLVGVPVFRDGLYFTVPSGDFEVAKACSGIRYLIASIALGVLFAYLTYRSQVRRALFIGAAVLVPLLANGLRAFGIVLLAHFSDQRLAVGVDHIVYGWLFFGIVMFALFWLGSLFRDEGPDLAARSGADGKAGLPGLAVGPVIAALALVALAPAVYVALMAAQPSALPSQQVALPAAAADWVGPRTPDGAWAPSFEAADIQLAGSYIHNGRTLDLYVKHYTRQSQGAELINNLNRITDGAAAWAVLSREVRSVTLPQGQSLQVNETRIRNNEHTMVLWYWYRVGGANLHVPALVKAREIWQRLTLAGTAASLVAVGATEHDQAGEAGALLKEFLQDHYAALVACVDPNVNAVECRP